MTPPLSQILDKKTVSQKNVQAYLRNAIERPLGLLPGLSTKYWNSEYDETTEDPPTM
jgi:hypothetical protein